METVLIVIHLLIVMALIVVVLLQRSEGGALGIGGGGNFMSARGSANVLTRTTAILVVAFFVTSLALSILARYNNPSGSILDRLPAEQLAPGDGQGILDQLRGDSADNPVTPTPVPGGGPQVPSAQ